MGRAPCRQPNRMAGPRSGRARICRPIRIVGKIPPGRPGPALGADTDAILGEIGLDAERITALRAAGVV